MNHASSFFDDEKRVELVPLDEGIHRSQFSDLNVEFLSWLVVEMINRHDVDYAAISGITVREYVESVMDEFLAVKPPVGITYLLRVDGRAIGTGALRKLEEGVGEIKRMYIRPEYRGNGYGRRLFKTLMKKGKEFGYSNIRLETSDFMTSTHKIYHSEGFIEVDQFPGCETPEPYLPFALFMEKKLQEQQDTITDWWFEPAGGWRPGLINSEERMKEMCAPVYEWVKSMK